MINRNGDLIGTYHKQNLYGPEVNDFVAGVVSGIFTLDFAKIGVMICFDIFSATVTAQYAEQGVEIIFCPSNMVIADIRYKKQQIDAIRSIYKSIVFQNKCFFATSMLNENSLIAQSMIISPKGIIKKARNSHNSLLIQEIDLRDLDILNSFL